MQGSRGTYNQPAKKGEGRSEAEAWFQSQVKLIKLTLLQEPEQKNWLAEQGLMTEIKRVTV